MRVKQVRKSLDGFSICRFGTSVYWVVDDATTHAIYVSSDLQCAEEWRRLHVQERAGRK